MSTSDVVLGAIEEATSGGQEADSDSDGDNGGFGSGFVGLVDTNALVSEPLIEEPVASGGDSSLWTDGEDPGSECAPGDETCEDGQ